MNICYKIEYTNYTFKGPGMVHEINLFNTKVYIQTVVNCVLTKLLIDHPLIKTSPVIER